VNKRMRMIKIVVTFQKYVATYTNCQGYSEYSDSTFIHDMLYGIGLAIDSKVFKFSPGYEKWKRRLIAFLSQPDLTKSEKINKQPFPGGKEAPHE